MMRLLEYYYFRAYIAYEQKNDSPRLNSFLFISVINATLIFIMILSSEAVLNKIGYEIQKPFSKVIGWMPLYGGVVISYLRFSIRDISYYKSLFPNQKIGKKKLSLWLIFSTPFLLFIGYPNIHILIFGGSILEYHFEGLINKLF